MTHHIERRATATIFTVLGEVDLLSHDFAAGLLALAETSTPTPLVVDLSACTYIDSSGLGALVRATKRAQRPLVVVGSTMPCVDRIFAICKLESQFRIVASVEDALAVAPSA